MPNFSNYLGEDKFPNYLGQRAQHLSAMNWRRISEKPSSIVLIRNGVALDPQIVRIENSNYGNITELFSGGEVGDQDMHILGLKDHDHLPDLDVQRGDLFIYDDKQFEVINTITTNIGWIQAFCEATSG